jgi:outer membrane biosynthesis protein TonB
MGTHHSLPLLACLSLALAPPAAAQTLQQPNAAWVVDYGETACTALRTYGRADRPTTLAFRPSPNGSIVRVMVARPGKAPPPSHFAVKTNVDPAGARLTGLRFGSSDGKTELTWINIDRAALDALPAAGEMAITGKGMIDERFAVPGIAAVLKSLDTCNGDLRAHWNAGQAAAAQLTRRAATVTPLFRLISNSDYPQQALQEGEGGLSQIVLLVDEKGKAKDCMIEQTSGIASLDAMACGVFLRRAKFTPALDAAGKPTRDIFFSRIKWVPTE